jgi:hypothetical protein
MADDQPHGGEVARAVFEALDALKAIEDPGVRAREITAFLKESGDRVKELSDLRREYVLDQRRQKVSLRVIAAQLGVHFTTVQNIESGHSGSGKTRPRKKGNAGGDDGEVSGKE